MRELSLPGVSSAMDDGGVLESKGGNSDVESYENKPNKPFTDAHDLPDKSHGSDITVADGEPGDQREIEGVPKAHGLFEVKCDKGTEKQNGQYGQQDSTS